MSEEIKIEEIKIKKLKHSELCEDCGTNAKYEVIEDMGLYPLTYYFCEDCLKKFIENIITEELKQLKEIKLGIEELKEIKEYLDSIQHSIWRMRGIADSIEGSEYLNSKPLKMEIQEIEKAVRRIKIKLRL
jgi:hypothetical protein